MLNVRHWFCLTDFNYTALIQGMLIASLRESCSPFSFRPLTKDMLHKQADRYSNLAKCSLLCNCICKQSEKLKLVKLINSVIKNEWPINYCVRLLNHFWNMQSFSLWLTACAHHSETSSSHPPPKCNMQETANWPWCNLCKWTLWCKEGKNHLTYTGKFIFFLLLHTLSEFLRKMKPKVHTFVCATLQLHCNTSIHYRYITEWSPYIGLPQCTRCDLAAVMMFKYEIQAMKSKHWRNFIHSMVKLSKR